MKKLVNIIFIIPFLIGCATHKIRTTYTCMHPYYTGKNEVNNAWDFTSKVLESDEFENDSLLLIQFKCGWDFYEDIYYAKEKLPENFHELDKDSRRSIKNQIKYVSASMMHGHGYCRIDSFYIDSEDKDLQYDFEYEGKWKSVLKIRLIEYFPGEFNFFAYSGNEIYHNIIAIDTNGIIDIKPDCHDKIKSSRTLNFNPIAFIVYIFK